jgi:hypothetical protein
MRFSLALLTATHRRSVAGAAQINLDSAKRYRSIEAEEFTYLACGQRLAGVRGQQVSDLLRDCSADVSVAFSLVGEVCERRGADYGRVRMSRRRVHAKPPTGV